MISQSMQELREKCSKDYYDNNARRLHYALLYITQYILKTNITPNQITIFWLFLQLVAAGFMLVGTYSFNIIGILLYTFAGFLDAIDGQVARIKKKSSYKGIFLEWLGVCFGSPPFFIAFSIGIARTYHNPWYVVLGFISALALLYSKVAIINPLDYKPEMREKIISLRDNLSMRNKKRKFAWIYLILRRSNPFNLLFLGIIINQPIPTLIIYTSFYVLELIRRLYVQLKMLYTLDKRIDCLSP